MTSVPMHTWSSHFQLSPGPGPFTCSLAVNCVSIAMQHETVGFPCLAPDVIKLLDSPCPLDV